MRRWKEYTIIYLIGSLGYGVIELLWRGRTHWSMLLTGGLCTLWMYFMNIRRFGWKLWQHCLAGAAFITGCELVVGIVFNLLLGRRIRDYSGKPGNFLGQVCPQYCVLWFLLCFPVQFLCRRLKKRLF